MAYSIYSNLLDTGQDTTITDEQLAALTGIDGFSADSDSSFDGYYNSLAHTKHIEYSWNTIFI